MRVLLANMTIDPEFGGGTAEKTVQTARALSKAGHSVTVLSCGEISTARRWEMSEIENVTLPLNNRRFWVPFPLVSRVRRVVSRADVVVVANHWTLINVLVASAARKLGVPYVVVPSGALALFGRSLRLKRLYNWFVGRKIVARAAAHIATTDIEVDHFKSYGIDPSRVTVIPNGIEQFAPRNPDVSLRSILPLGDSPYLLFVGRLASIKGPDLLLDAFARISSEVPHHLVYAGPDEGLRPELEQAATQARLQSRVHFPGFLKGDIKQAAYEDAAAVIIPSRAEAMSLVVLEAGLLARPVLMTDRCGMAEAGEEGVVLVTTPEASEIAAGIETLLGFLDHGESMGRRLRESVENNYSWTVVARHYERVFEGVLSK